MEAHRNEEGEELTEVLTQVYPFIGGVRVWRRHVELTHRESPLLTLTLQHRTKVGYMLHT